MACPYFEPGERLPLSSGSLGDLYAGQCLADASAARQPDSETVADRCNLGYARGRCSHFPTGGPDAIRFSVARHRDGVIGVLYSIERDHRPLSSGAIDYSVVSNAFAVEPPSGVGKLASAYVRSYLRRTIA